jgi:CHAT domain-containing protein
MGDTADEPFWFEKLTNLEKELALFQRLKRRRSWSNGNLEIDIFKGRKGHSFHAALEQKLSANQYSFVHFAGHSYRRGGQDETFLVLPSLEEDRVVRLPIKTFARWAGASGANFIYLSSCRGSSSDSVRRLAQEGVPLVLGFRWDVEDDKAAKFAESFYLNLLDGGQPYAKAYRNACGAVHDEFFSSPIWVSPVLVMQSKNWWNAAPHSVRT